MNSAMLSDPAAISIQNDRDSFSPTLLRNSEGSGVAGSPTCAKPLSSGVVDSAHMLEKSALSQCWSRLPADILIVIVRRALVTTQFGNRDPYHDYMSVHASQVCRQWRSIVLNAPLLWNYITTAHDVDHKNHSRQTLVFIRHLLHRSQSATLEVELKLIHETAPQFNGPCFSRDALDAIFRQMHRIRRLDITVLRHHALDDNTFPSVLKYLRQPAPCLESLYLWCMTSDTTPTPFLGYTALWPALKDADLYNFDVPLSAWPNSFPTSRSLTQLALSSCANILPTASEVLRILDDYPDLVSLTLTRNHDRGWNTEDFVPYDFSTYASSSTLLPTTTHYRLQRMHCEMEFRELFQLFRSLNAPALDEWTLKSCQTPHPGASHFLLQAMPPIQASLRASYAVSETCIKIDMFLKTSQSDNKGHFQACIWQTPRAPDIIESLISLLRSPNTWQAIDIIIFNLNRTHIDGTAWHHLLTASPNLRKLSLLDTRSTLSWDSERLLEALMGVYDRDRGCATGVLQTSLQRLCIAAYISDEGLDKLITFAVSRKRSGGPLSEVEIQLRKSQWAALDKLDILGDAVESLIVDGTRYS